MLTKINKFLRNSKGATAIEYGLIAALIAVASWTSIRRAERTASATGDSDGDRDTVLK